MREDSWGGLPLAAVERGPVGLRALISRCLDLDRLYAVLVFTLVFFVVGGFTLAVPFPAGFVTLGVLTPELCFAGVVPATCPDAALPSPLLSDVLSPTATGAVSLVAICKPHAGYNAGPPTPAWDTAGTTR